MSTVKAFSLIKRGISTSPSLYGKRNFRKFLVGDKRGTKEYRDRRFAAGLNQSKAKPTGFVNPGTGRYVTIPEMQPELIVPSEAELRDTQLKPYVSYRAPDVVQSEFTAKDLFLEVYGEKISNDFKAKKLDANGNPMDPSENEKLTPEEAYKRARKTGSDIFT